MPVTEGFTGTVSIIVPALDEGPVIAGALGALQQWREQGHEVILVDGGSRDDTVERTAGLADLVLSAPRGRASQMNAGAQAARGEVLLFLHADTSLPPGAIDRVGEALARQGRQWGRFDVRIEGRIRLLGMVAAMMNLRSRLTGIATGDQAMFVRRHAFAAAGGFPPLALMEDIALSARLRKLSWPACLRDKAVTSGRRWERNGVVRTVFLMWWLRLRFFLGVRTEVLARHYDRPAS